MAVSKSLHCHPAARGRRARAALYCLAACLLCLAAGCAESVSVATVPTEPEAIEIINILNEQGIESRKEEVGEEGARQWRVTLTEETFGRGKLARALRVLQEHGLPRPHEKGLEGAYDQQGMFPSESAQKAQRLKELKTEIERQLRLLPGVSRVSVNVVPPEDDVVNLDPFPATASVLIIHRDERPSFTTAHVQELVSRGVPKLKPENVSVVAVQEPEHRVATAHLEAQRRTDIISFIALGLLLILTLSLAATLLVVRRRRRRLAAPPQSLRAPADAPPSDGPRLVTAPAAGPAREGPQGA